MSLCPKCNEPLRAEDYEDIRILRCRQCKGVLVPQHRVELISHRRKKDQDTLKREAQAEFTADTRKQIRCPQCFNLMEKRPIATRYTDIRYDLCRPCGHIWLDGGELAMMQLVFERSLRGKQAEEFRQREIELETNPERRARFYAALKNVPQETRGTDTRVADELLLDLLKLLILRWP